MGRPPAHDADALLDAAVSLHAISGARAVTMSAVAREVGAPSGSVYHRFPDRPSLLASMWLRTVRRFQSGWFSALDAEPPITASVAGARYTVDWCRAHFAQATVLYAGKRAFGAEGWPDRLRAEVAENERALQQRIHRAVDAVVEVTNLPHDDVLLAIVDVPYAAVHRYLEQGKPPPPRVRVIVERAVRTLLATER